MARQVQLRRGTTAQTSSFTGAIGEVTVDTDKDTVVVHDGSTAGGHPLTKNSTLGTAATTAATDYATAAQGTTADSAVQPNDNATLGNVSVTSLAVTGTVDGRDIAADGTKLDGVEASADVTDTVNVTAAGALMDSEVTNLTQVKAFDTTDYATSAQGTTADAALPKSGGAMTGAITTNSTFDGRDVSVDGAKLDNIEAGATADQTGAQIKTAYEAEANAFTDAQFTKLAGVEASADVTDVTNVTAAGALMDSEVTNLAQVKAFDTTDYATAAQGATADAALPKAGGTMTGALAGTSISASGELIAASYNETYAAVTSTTNATTVNCEAGNTFSHTLTENTTFTFSNPPASGTGYTMSIEIIQDGSASGFTVTWPTSVDWPAATAPTITATASAKDVFVFTTRDGGTTWYGFTAGQALA